MAKTSITFQLILRGPDGRETPLKDITVDVVPGDSPREEITYDDLAQRLQKKIDNLEARPYHYGVSD